jgi:hypothetical protein
MNFKISKLQYDSIVKKLFSTFIGNITFDKLRVGQHDYIELFDKSGDNFADIWKNNSKRCKRSLSLHTDVSELMEKFSPVFRKKMFAKSLIKYVYEKTNIKCDCVTFEYDTEYVYDDDGYVNDITNKIYKYKRKKK